MKCLSVSVIIVAYHSRRDLERCLPTLYQQSIQPLEVIIVNNSPDDGLATWLCDAYPQAQVIANAANTGYAGGNNLGVEQASGEYVLILNPDTELRPGSLEALVGAVQRRPEALIAAKLLRPDGTINACGLKMHFTGITFCRGLDEHASAYPGLHGVPLASGAAFIVSKELFLELKGFDEVFFMYMEDADFSLRASLWGIPVLCAGDAHITHHYQLAMSPNKFYFLERNRLLTLFKLYRLRTLSAMLPALLVTEFATWGFALLKGRGYLAAKLKGYTWLWRTRREWGADRRYVQQRRKHSDRHLLNHSVVTFPFDQLLSNRRLVAVLDSLTRPLYRALFGWVKLH